MPNSDTRSLVLGIDPGLERLTSAATTVLTLDAEGTVGLQRPAVHLQKEVLPDLLLSDPLLSDPHLHLATIAAPMTPKALEVKPFRPRSIEIRLSRGAFSGSARGPSMPWISSPSCWSGYRRATQLQEILNGRGLPLLAMPAEEMLSAVELPLRCLAEVYPKATLALLSPISLLMTRPSAKKFMGQLDDWLFPRLFGESEILQSIAPSLPARTTLKLSPETVEEARRISRICRPFPRREPLRSFIAAFQGILALHGAASLVGQPGSYEGSILLPAAWHPDWEAEWNDQRRDRRIKPLRRVSVLSSAMPASKPANLPGEPPDE